MSIPVNRLVSIACTWSLTLSGPMQARGLLAWVDDYILYVLRTSEILPKETLLLQLQLRAALRPWFLGHADKLESNLFKSSGHERTLRSSWVPLSCSGQVFQIDLPVTFNLEEDVAFGVVGTSSGIIQISVSQD
ncbi:hypothetical protein [Primus virus]|uniref:Uncharacterized protein n=1 Tax=Primus virus TaxID=2722918 RepID=A0A6H0C762_9RHAB|nr:hypothetical protein [Primus virus]